MFPSYIALFIKLLHIHPILLSFGENTFTLVVHVRYVEYLSCFIYYDRLTLVCNMHYL